MTAAMVLYPDALTTGVPYSPHTLPPTVPHTMPPPNPQPSLIATSSVSPIPAQTHKEAYL